MGHERFDTVVIGGGQAGLTVGYELQRAGRDFVILDAHERVGDAWRTRWDSLRLFTPARYDGLPGLKFPAPGDHFPSKDEMADYLEAYARRFELPVRTGTRVDRLSRPADRFVIRCGDDVIEADNVVVAMSRHQQPRIPAFADAIDESITQVHSKAYRRPDQLPDGPVLVVGLGNSGADIALELAKSRPTIVAGTETATIPFRIETWVARNVLIRGVRFVGQHILTIRTPIGRKARPHIVNHAAPLIRVKPKDLEQAGVRRVGRLVGVRGGLPVTEDDETLDVDAIVWCTGFRSGFEWIDLPVLGERQEPRHDRGIADDVPGLYFVGQPFVYSETSETVTGMPRDARRVVKHLTTTRPAVERVPVVQA